MEITETDNTDFTRTVILCKVVDTLRTLMPCSQKLSAGAKNNKTPERR